MNPCSMNKHLLNGRLFFLYNTKRKLYLFLQQHTYKIKPTKINEAEVGKYLLSFFFSTTYKYRNDYFQ